MDAALLETGKKKSQEVETKEHQSEKQKTCKRLIMALISNPCSGLGQQEQQWAKPALGMVKEGRSCFPGELSYRDSSHPHYP